MEKITLTFQDALLILTFLTTVISTFYALKYKNQKNSDDNKDIKTELEEIDKKVTNLNSSLAKLLSKKEAEEKYVTKLEHELTLKNINLKLENISEVLNDFKKNKEV